MNMILNVIKFLFLIVINKKVNARKLRIRSGKNGPLTKAGTIRINKKEEKKSTFVSKYLINLFRNYFINLSIKLIVDLSIKKSEP